MRGVQTRPESWRELLHSDAHGGATRPMMMWAHEVDPDPDMRPPPIPDDAREEVHLQMVAGLTRINRHFEPARRPYAASPPVAPIRTRTLATPTRYFTLEFLVHPVKRPTNGDLI